ncbi:hypothetical protein [Caballeronia sp. GACF4]|uniref:hypothetical protein n=1 Tax=Caballeronia sp. GACF4 TaxID=2921763 RepID=UPI002028BBF5|nr:hypothetical protein [Caballeronia sp. GACF4]
MGVEYSPNDAFIGFDKKGAAYEVQTAKGRRIADILVFAGGVGNEDMLRGAELVAPLENSVGSVVHLSALPPLFERVIFSPRVHAILRQDGRIVIAQHFTGSPLGDPTASDPRALLETARTVIAGLEDAVIEKVTSTKRVIPIDGLPVISESEALLGVVAITTMPQLRWARSFPNSSPRSCSMVSAWRILIRTGLRDSTKRSLTLTEPEVLGCEVKLVRGLTLASCRVRSC